MIKTLNNYFIEDFLIKSFSCLMVGEKARLLDLGCGEQPYKKLYEKYFSEIITADVEDRSGKTQVLLKSDIMPFENAYFDVVLFTEVIEHMPDPFVIMAEIERILKTGGLLLITWPFNFPLHEIPNDNYRFTEFLMHDLLKRNNMEIKKIIRRGNWWSVLHMLLFQLSLNVNEFFRRIPILGFILRPVCFMIDKLLQSANYSHFKLVSDFKTLNPSKPGEGLKGIAGSFAGWTLGYCILAQKQT